MDLIKLYLLFWIFAFLGWVVEMIYCAITDKQIVNRGFFIGPYCPIYGFGGISMLLFLPYKDNPLVCFILALVTCSVLEYFTSYLMEKIFQVRWWDYSNDSFNINGRICLRNALAFGALGVLLTKYIYPFFKSILDGIPDETIKTVALIILIITLIDIIVSFKAMSKIKEIVAKNVKNFKNKDATASIRKILKDNFKLSFLERRLIDTYHLFEKKFHLKTKGDYLIILVIIIVSIILGIVLSYFLHNYRLIPLIISIGILLSFIISKVRNEK